MIVSRRTQKRIQNLGNICDFDLENAVATLNLHFKSISELVDEKMGTSDDPVIHSDLLKMLEDNLDIVPREFKVNYRIWIEDYQGYDQDRINNAFFKAKETFSFRRKTANLNKLSRMTRFFFIGLILIFPLVLNEKYKWFESSGRMISAIIAFFLELGFELFYEDGICYFTVGRIYYRSERKNQNRIGSISIIKAP